MFIISEDIQIFPIFVRTFFSKTTLPLYDFVRFQQLLPSLCRTYFMNGPWDHLLPTHICSYPLPADSRESVFLTTKNCYTKCLCRQNKFFSWQRSGVGEFWRTTHWKCHLCSLRVPDKTEESPRFCFPPIEATSPIFDHVAFVPNDLLLIVLYYFSRI